MNEAYILLQLQLWAISNGASSLIADIQPYEPCRAFGLIRSLRFDPVRGVMEGSVTDGTGWLVARWHLSNRPDLHGHRAVCLEGVPRAGDDGSSVMEDPEVEVVSPPDYLKVG